MSRQVDLVIPRHILKVALDVRLLHEAEAQLHADDAAAFLVAVEYNDVIAILVDVGNLRVDDFDKDEVAPERRRSGPITD